MAVSMEQILQALASMTETMDKLMKANEAKAQTNHYWGNTEKYKNIKSFNGSMNEWEEFSRKFKSQAAAGSSDAAEILQSIEEEISEAEAEKEDWSKGQTLHTDTEFSQISKKIYNLLMSLTTGEANASVRRCRGNGLRAWKIISSALNRGRWPQA